MNLAKQLSVMLSLCSFSFIVIAISIYPMAGEDFALTKTFNNASIIDRLSFSFDRSAYQIEHWNARLGEQLAIFSLSMPGWFSIGLSILSLMLIIYLITLIAGVKKPYAFNVCTLFSIFITLWPGFELFTWRTVVSGYTIPMCITLFVIYAFSSMDILSKVKKNNTLFYTLILASFLSGLSFENVPVALVFFMIASLVINKNIFSKLLILPITCFTGWLALILAPSTSYRVSVYNSMYNITKKDTSYYIDRALDVISTFANTSLTLFTISFFCLIHLAYKKELTKEIIALLVASVMVTGSMAASPYTEPRSFMLAWCVMLIVVFKSVYIIKKDYMLYKPVFLLSIISLVTAGYVLRNIYDYSIILADREHLITMGYGKDDCKRGIKLNRAITNYDYRYVNNRDGWYFNNLGKVSLYYNCKLYK